MIYKITHLTSVHPRYDTRIFVKECQSLAKIDDYHVSLIVADGKGDEAQGNIQIYDVGESQGRLKRMFSITKLVYKKAVILDSDIYHIHDPELLPVGLKLKKLGKKVIFDAHEDTSIQILGKTYINLYLRKILSVIFTKYEKYAISKFDTVVTATAYIREKFADINRSVDINNYPILDEFQYDNNWDIKENEICYIGGISRDRGIEEIVQALEKVENCRLNLAGDFKEKVTKERVENFQGWGKVNELGYLTRDGVKKVLQKSKIGLVTLYPLENYKEALPVKMFEYMSAGIPVIISNFSLWEEIVLTNRCGLSVDPLNVEVLASKINYLLKNPELSYQMGKKGRVAVETKYNWSIEEQKLYSLYRELI